MLWTSWFRRCHATLNWTKIHKASEVEEHPMNFCIEEAKLAHPNWHRGESNMRPWGGAHSKVPSQHQQANPSGLSTQCMKRQNTMSMLEISEQTDYDNSLSLGM